MGLSEKCKKSEKIEMVFKPEVKSIIKKCIS